MVTFTALRPFLVLFIVLTGTCIVTAPAIAADRKPVPVPSAPREMTFDSLRGVQYAEIWMLVGTPQTGLTGHYFNTSNLNNSKNTMDTCPASIWDKVNTSALKAEYNAYVVFKNGPRGWTMDSIKIPVGPVVTFEGLQTRWWGKGVLPAGVDFKDGLAPYKPLKSHRTSTFLFKKGKPVFVLDDKEGTPWVMQAFSKIKDPALTYESLETLGAKIKLPEGWKYRVVVLDKDLIISAPQGYNWIVQDELENTYDACKDGACNYKP
jgi:hypothetical protein